MLKQFITFGIAYLVAYPCYYAGYMFEVAVRAFRKGRSVMRDDVAAGINKGEKR